MHVCVVVRVFVARASVCESNRRKHQCLRNGSSSTISTHIVVKEVLDGSVHLCRDVRAFDLIDDQPQAQKAHCPHHGNHSFNTLRVCRLLV